MNLPAPERLNLTYGVAVGRLGLDGKAGLVEILVLEVLPSAPWGPARRGRGPREWVRTSRPLPPTPKCCLSPGVATRERPVRAPGLHTGQVPLSCRWLPFCLFLCPWGHCCPLSSRRSEVRPGQQSSHCSSATICTAHILFTSCLFSVQWLVLDFHNVSSFA